MSYDDSFNRKEYEDKEKFIRESDKFLDMFLSYATAVGWSHEDAMVKKAIKLKKMSLDIVFGGGLEDETI